MNCADVQQVLPEIIDGSSSGDSDAEYQAHLKSCPMCSELVSDLELIASEARQLSETDDPAPRVWVKIAAELRSEGIIRELEAAPGRPVLVPGVRRRWNAWWLVPVAAALVAAGSYVIKPKPAVPVASQNPPAAVINAEKVPAPSTVASAKPSKQIAPVRAVDETRQSAPADRAPMQVVGTADQQLLDGVPPELRSEYQSQLNAVNSYIRDAEAYLKQNPDDEDARQHLMEANQQREMLYRMALDHVQ